MYTAMRLKRRSSAILAGCLLAIATAVHHAEAAEARRLDQAIANAQPIVQSGFDVYLAEDGNRLIYVKDECGEADVGPKFFLHVVPTDRSHLPEHLRQYDFESLDFHFGDYGTLSDGRCIAIRPLPDYDISAIRTGQYIRGQGKLWKVRFPFERFRNYLARLKPYRTVHASIVSGGFGEPAARSIFDVYHNGDKLIYLKESCGTEDVEAPFFLHVVPVDVDTLPAHRKRAGFDNLNFSFHDYGTIFDGKCLVIGVLPDYALTRIETGQYIIGVGQVWKAEIPVGEQPRGGGSRKPEYADDQGIRGGCSGRPYSCPAPGMTTDHRTTVPPPATFVN